MDEKKVPHEHDDLVKKHGLRHGDLTHHSAKHPLADSEIKTQHAKSTVPQQGEADAGLPHDSVADPGKHH